MAYEQTIAGKLEALPLPDMADAIWARIEAQLDLELPTDDGPGGDAPDFPTGGFVIGGIGLIVLAVLIAFFSSSKTNQNSKPSNNIQPPASQTIQSTVAKPPGNTGSSNTPNASTAIPFSPSVTSSAEDSNTVVQQPFVAPADSVFATPPLVTTALATPVPKADTTQPVKKQRGAQGINDADYRIVPKKDTTGN